MKPLEEAERKLAEVTARVIAKAEEVGLPDAPEKLVTPHALRFLARAHLELLDQVREIPDRINQIARVAIGGALREVARQQGGIATEQIVNEATSEGMLAAKPLMTALPSGRPGICPRCGSKPGDNGVSGCAACVGLHVVPAPAEAAKLDGPDLLALYYRIMRETEGAFVKYESYIVRLWDGMDGCWTDCTGDVGRDEALRYWAEKTNGGAHHVTYAEIDYYRIFPGGTRMMWDGSEGREMHR